MPLGTNYRKANTCLPRFAFALLKNFFFSSKDNSGDSRINSSARSSSVKYAGAGLKAVDEHAENDTHSIRSFVPRYVFGVS
jgi:hypothetical protein